MSQGKTSQWRKKTPETEQVEATLREEFPEVEAYRYNSASIRVRVIDSRFEGKSVEDRDAMVERLLKQLPEEIQSDIMNLITVTPDELKNSWRHSLRNREFDDPSPSML